MTVNIPPELEQYLEEKVASGEFESKDAFVSEAMRIYRALEARHEQLRSDVKQAIDQIDRGDGIEIDSDNALSSFFDDIKSRGRQRLENRAEG